MKSGTTSVAKELAKGRFTLEKQRDGIQGIHSQQTQSPARVFGKGFDSRTTKEGRIAVMTYRRSLKDVPRTFDNIGRVNTYLFLPPAMGDLKVEKKLAE